MSGVSSANTSRAPGAILSFAHLVIVGIFLEGGSMRAHHAGDRVSVGNSEAD